MSTQARVVLITGASSGIGYETALAFARNGDHVGAVARRLDRLDALIAAANGLPGAILPLAADVTDPLQMQTAVDRLVKEWGRLDILVANAGLGQRGSVVDSNWADLEVVLRTNIDGVLHSVRAAVPAMRQSASKAPGTGGHIILISSVVSLAIGPYSTVYSATKATVNAIARGLRAELVDDHIWVTNVLVGQTHSEFAQSRRGTPGRVASNLPTMSAAYVAECLVRTADHRRRTITLRWLDRAINLAGNYFPWLMDRYMARTYKTH